MSNDLEGATGPLTGIRVLDLTEGLGAYASRLLADLGADVVRVEPPEPQPASPDVDVHARFANAGKRSITLDIRRAEGRLLLRRLFARSDVLIEGLDPSWADANGLSPDAIAAEFPSLVHVCVTAFGRDQTDMTVPHPDLTILAAGGLLHLGGYPDAEPVAAYGRQSDVAASLFAAVGALVGLLDRAATGRAPWIDVSAQESIAQALEDSVATYELTGHVRMRLGGEPREAGSGIYPCADGFVAMVAGRLGTAKAWRALVEWLVEVGVPGADELTAPEWSTLTHRQRAPSIETFGRIFGGLTAHRSRHELYVEAQRRQIALSPVNDIASVLADPQLAARDFFVEVEDPGLGRRLTYPGPPYRLSETPASAARPARPVGEDSTDVFAEALGVESSDVESLLEAGIA
jgi:benzylsuccinate CoA-transferase BbsE subunit